MRQAAHLVTGLASLIALAGCGEAQEPVAYADNHVTIRGSAEDVARFAELQQSRRPALGVSDPEPVEGGMRSVTIEFPEDSTTADLKQVMRDAAAAGLSYSIAMAAPGENKDAFAAATAEEGQPAP